MELQTENDRLKHDTEAMATNYLRQIESKEDALRTLKSRLEDTVSHESRSEVLSRRETEQLKSENRILRDKIAELSRELGNGQYDRRAPNALDALESENKRLRADILDKEKEYTRQFEQLRALMSDRDSATNKQKNEWAEIYGNMKREGEELKRNVRMLNAENEKLVKQLEIAKQSGGRGADAESAKRLKKRELECQALWETLRDMYHGEIRAYDTNRLLEILALRALDTKAKRKLAIR